MRGGPAAPGTPAVGTLPEAAPLPTGFTVLLSRRTRTRPGSRTLVGGTAGTVVRLRGEAVGRIGQDHPLRVRDPVDRALARRLLDAGLADPTWPGTDPGTDEAVADVTVVVPVRDRAGDLAALLAALPRRVPVLVVDDGSRDGASVAAVAAGHGARLLVHPVNRGPAAARNTGLRACGTPYVAFCDSDVLPRPGWLAALRRHLDDPAVGVVAPRVRDVAPPPGAGRLERYEHVRSSLDLGPLPAAVRPGGAVSYVPSACLLARVAALGDGFDERMRVAEDVDLVWRLVGAGWRVRYEPVARVGHRNRVRLRPWLARKAYYGTGAADLAARHGGAVAPLVLAPWSVVVSVALLAQRRWSPAVVTGASVAATAALARRLAGDETPVRTAAGLTGAGLVGTAHQLAGSLLRHHWPVAVLAATRSRRARRALLAAAVLEGLADRRGRGGVGSPGPVTHLVLHRADDLAYGAGLWWGALRAGSARALAPAWRRPGGGWRARAGGWPGRTRPRRPTGQRVAGSPV